MKLSKLREHQKNGGRRRKYPELYEKWKALKGPKMRTWYAVVKKLDKGVPFEDAIKPIERKKKVISETNIQYKTLDIKILPPHLLQMLKDDKQYQKSKEILIQNGEWEHLNFGFQYTISYLINQTDLPTKEKEYLNLILYLVSL